MCLSTCGYRLLRIAAAFFAAALCAGGTSLAAEEAINGFSVWNGEGTVYETGPGMGTFVGAISGMLFIETEKGPVPAGKMVCPATLEVNLQNATQVGEGKCTITSEDGSMVFATWSCQGVHLVGCDGKLTVVGGSGRMDGITGKGALLLRTVTQFAVLQARADGTVAESGTGILVIKDLTYSVPSP